MFPTTTTISCVGEPIVAGVAGVVEPQHDVHIVTLNTLDGACACTRPGLSGSSGSLGLTPLGLRSSNATAIAGIVCSWQRASASDPLLTEVVCCVFTHMWSSGAPGGWAMATPCGRLCIRMWFAAAVPCSMQLCGQISPCFTRDLGQPFASRRKHLHLGCHWPVVAVCNNTVLLLLCCGVPAAGKCPPGFVADPTRVCRRGADVPLDGV